MPPNSLSATRGGLMVAAIWSLAVLVSALQIYLRELSLGVMVPWSEVLLANLLAWLPWLLAVAPVLGLERRFPVAGPLRWRHLALHLVAAAATSAVFLLYLALFHLLYLDGAELPLTASSVVEEYVEKLGRFFLTGAALYGLIVVAGFAQRGWRGRQRSSVAERPARSVPAEIGAIIVRSAGRVERIDPAAVRWISSEGNYARLHLEGRSVLHRQSLAGLAADLAARRFVRIHRSTLVNLHHVRELRRRSHGDAVVRLDDGTQLKVSRTYRGSLRELDL